MTGIGYVTKNDNGSYKGQLKTVSIRVEIDIIPNRDKSAETAGIERAASDHAIFDPASDGRVVGRLAAEGLSDELRERRYVIVDGIDGRTQYVELGLWKPLVRNTIIELRAREIAPRAVDQTIAEIASRNHGLYSVGLHGAADPAASAEFIQTHVRRLEAMRWQGLAERLADGGWRLGPDHLDRAARFEEVSRLQRPVRMTVLSWQNLEALPGAAGATWLDRQLVAKTPETIAPAGMDFEVGAALAARRQWLLDQGFAREDGGGIAYARNLLQTLERRELAEVAARIAGETGLGYAEIKPGDRLNGTYRRMLTLSSGRFALIERAHDFSLVPWRPVLERAKGQSVTGVVGGEGISWPIGIKRGLGR